MVDAFRKRPDQRGAAAGRRLTTSRFRLGVVARCHAEDLADCIVATELVLVTRNYFTQKGVVVRVEFS